MDGDTDGYTDGNQPNFNFKCYTNHDEERKKAVSHTFVIL